MVTAPDHNADAAAAGGRLTIDLSALRANWRGLAERSHPAETAAVVKANAYGLGIEHAVPALFREGCRTFFVALAEEGVAVRRAAAGARVFVLNGFFSGSGALYRDADLVPVLGNVGQVEAWQGECPGRPFALQVDTGMNRLGLSPGEARSFASAMRDGGAPEPVMVMTHLACADAPAHPLNIRQLDLFREVRSAFGGVEASMANSAGVFLGPDYRFDLVRPGIALYGGEAVDGMANPMAPVVTLEGRVVTVRAVPAGETIGYGATATATRESRIATVSVGYADGYPRSASGSGVPLRRAVAAGASGFVADRRVPIAGRVTMDLTMFDVTECGRDAVVAGDHIELIGANVPLDEVARSAGTIGYELLTGLGRRYERHFVGG